MFRETLERGFCSASPTYGPFVGIIRDGDGRYGCYYTKATFMTDAEGARERLRADRWSDAFWPAVECDGWIYVYRPLFSKAPALSPEAQFALLREGSRRILAMGAEDCVPLAYLRVDARHGQKYGYIFTAPDGTEVAVRYGNIKHWAPTFREARTLTLCARIEAGYMPTIILRDASGKLVAEFGAR